MLSTLLSLRKVALALPLVALSACGAIDGQTRADLSTSGYAPPMRWDHRPEASSWTAKSFAALTTTGVDLPEIEPADIATWCPGYPTASEIDRKAFWVGLLSTLSKHESTWNPRAVGGGGRWFGLVQIAPATARHRGCAVGTGEALMNGAANLRCAVRIMAQNVERDGVVSRGMRGVAAEWGPFHNSQRREGMRAWVSEQAYCSI